MRIRMATWVKVSVGAAAMLALACSTETESSETASDVETGVDGDTDADADADMDSDTGTDTDSDADGDTDTDSDADGDTDTDTDTDSDADGDTDADSDMDTDADSDADADGDADTDTDTDSDTDADTDADADTDTGGAADTGGDTDSDTAPASDTEPEVEVCEVPEDEFGNIDDCSEIAPPKSFEPDLQWSWSGEGEEIYSVVTPLVANLTDDNGDGVINLCDVPDVVVVAFEKHINSGGLYVLDGATGAMHFRAAAEVNRTVTPALGDIDNDGIPEIVSAEENGTLIAFEHDGTVKWRSSAQWPGETSPGHWGSAVALADLDQDGDVEIIAGSGVFDHEGALLWAAPERHSGATATAVADLDGEPGLEVVLGNSAYHADGTVYYRHDTMAHGFPQIADMDGDGLPEVLFSNDDGLTMLEHDGTPKYQDLRPTGQEASSRIWGRPATIHDFDGDGEVEFALSSASLYTLYESDATIVWSAEVADISGGATGTAFDFLGDGTAEAMYADESRLFVYDEAGIPLLEMPRTSFTLIEYPVVADVDNDGSAEIVVVSTSHGANRTSPTVQVIRDREDRWIQARRIWNQHTYHVTNVREDGTIPRVASKNWELFNTFRTNIQIEKGSLCHTIPII